MGNALLIFKQALQNNDTLVHELGHTFALPHFFQAGSWNKHQFYQGHSDNIMDYTWYSKVTPYNIPPNFKNLRVSFSKWQWELIRNDRSMHL